MRTMTIDDFDAAAVVDELLDGGGAIRFPGLFTDDQVGRARAVVESKTSDAAFTGSHFNQGEDDARLQRRVWNLFAHGEVFGELITQPVIIESMRAFLGSDFIVGSYCASRTMPGFGGQEPHIDYPYWDFHRSHSFPARINSSFPLNCQGTVIIDPFTVESGATAYRPGSAARMKYPSTEDRFFDDYQQMLGDPGDLILFYGLTWHCAMPNRSDHGRTGLLIEFLPKFVTPIEDMLSGLPEGFLDQADPMVKQMLGQCYPWPSQPPHPPLVDA
ncbi:MAG: phytanoyl-CoA dioxygenase family protein [Acidimicrobiia bacterium]|nr:phytanoyl-CoA dioxygenase family protein [Acidimicrobiia bacterium]